MTSASARRRALRDSNRLIAVDLFAGAGGLSLGFEQAGFDVLVAVDNDPIHLAVHKHNFPLTEVLCGDVRKLQPEDIDTLGRKAWSGFNRPGEWGGTIDCLIGGPSCQGFSYIGQHSDDDERNSLVYEFARLVRDLKPRSFVLENVPGLMSQRYEGTIRSLLARFRRAGYSLYGTPMLLDAVNYGVPQFRTRVFFVGVRIGEPAPHLPPIWASSPTVEEALADLDCDVSNTSGPTNDYVRSLRGPFHHEYPRAVNTTQLTGCDLSVHSPAVVSRFQALGPDCVDDVSHYKRLAGEGKSPTLRAGTGRDHGSFTAPRPIHHKYPRVITVREAARLHSFPDWFQFHKTIWHGFREIGNSVPPRLAYNIASTLAHSISRGKISDPLARLDLGPSELLTMTLQEAADYFDYDRALLPRDSRRISLRGTE